MQAALAATGALQAALEAVALEAVAAVVALRALEVGARRRAPWAPGLGACRSWGGEGVGHGGRYPLQDGATGGLVARARARAGRAGLNPP